MNMSTMLKTSALTAFVIALSTTANAAPAAPAAAPAAAATAPAAKAPAAAILFLDRQAVLRNSAVGKDMAAQAQALVKKMEAEFGPENAKLQADMQAFQSQASVLAPAARDAKMKELEARRDAFKKKIQDRQASIQAGLTQSRQKVEQAIGPILEKLMTARAANLLLDRSLVVLGKTELDISNEVIAQLNTALPKVTVTLAAPPAATAAAGAAARPATGAAAGH
jgi:outer membrane protein